MAARSVSESCRSADAQSAAPHRTIVFANGKTQILTHEKKKSAE
jgi:hypothetical protein